MYMRYRECYCWLEWFYWDKWGIEFLWDFAQLLPANLFQFGAKVNMSHCEVLWKTSQGMTKCVIVGIVGTVLAIVAGIVMLRKKEV